MGRRRLRAFMTRRWRLLLPITPVYRGGVTGTPGTLCCATTRSATSPGFAPTAHHVVDVETEVLGHGEDGRSGHVMVLQGADEVFDEP